MTQASKPYAPACDENRDPILQVIGPLFRGVRRVLEIGSGTGQHAVYFAAAMPHLSWQTSDRPEYHPGIQAWLGDAAPPNVLSPLELDVAADSWPETGYDGVFSANTAHIMSWPEVQSMFRGVASVLIPGGVFALYGPFNYGGRHTSESNARFDAQLRQRDPASGIKDLDDLRALGGEVGLVLAGDRAMPVNNRTLVWRKAAATR